MNPSSAPGPDGLPVIFFQTFWNVIKPEVMAIFEECFIGSIDRGRLNYGIISLIPKVPGAYMSVGYLTASLPVHEKAIREATNSSRALPARPRVLLPSDATLMTDGWGTPALCSGYS